MFTSRSQIMLKSSLVSVVQGDWTGVPFVYRKMI